MFQNRLALRIIRFLKIFFFSFGVLFFIGCALAFTRIPFDVQWWLGTNESDYKFKPDYIIFMGGSGMPSQSNLIRLYYTAVLAIKYPEAKIIIAHPLDDDVIQSMKKELITHAVDSTRILIERQGTNTREQTLKIGIKFYGIKTSKVVVVTSPENMLRTVKTFRKAGFKHVGGEAAFENAMFVDLSYDFKKAGGKRFAPDVSDNISLRYNFWNYLCLEVQCIREFTALGYYKLNGWI